MMAIPQYKILQSSDSFNLESNIERWMRDGWVPQGGIATLWNGVKTAYTQAMTKGVINE